MGTLLIETKENSPEKLAAIAGKDTKYYFMAEELNDIVEAINIIQDATANTPLFSKITKPNGFSLVGQTLTINALWEWLLLNIAYSNVAAVVFPDIPLCAEGKKRFVYFVPNSANTFEMISGPEGVIPIAPTLPNEGIYATYLLITDTVIEEPANPNPNNTPSLNAVTNISGESFNPISVLEYGVGGATLYKNIFSMWRYIGAISKYINIKWDDLTTTYDIRFPAKANGSTQTLAMISDVDALSDEVDSKILASNKFKGVYLTFAALTAAHPTASEGDSAQVNEVGATDVVNYSWDDEENIWVQNGSAGSGATNTDMLPEGSSNLYFTTARVLATLLSGLSLATGGQIVSTDSVLVAFGKIQKQITDIANSPSQITITTSISITTDTLDASGYSQKGRNVVIDNGVNAINITVNGDVGFIASYLKHGTGVITFTQGSGRTLIQVDGTNILNGAVGSTSTISSVGTKDYLRISNT